MVIPIEGNRMPVGPHGLLRVTQHAGSLASQDSRGLARGHGTTKSGSLAESIYGALYYRWQYS